MVLKRIKSRKDIPWFDINNYDYIRNIDDIALLEEVIMRTCIYEHAGEGRIDKSGNSFIWSEILNGQPDTEQSFNNEPFDPKISQRSELKQQQLKVLSSNEAVNPVPCAMLDHYHSRLKEKENQQKLSAKDNEQEIIKFSYSDFMGDSSIICNIGLDNYTDDEILMALKHHLPLWRKDLNISEPKKRFIKPAEIEKIRDYRIIPFLDLMIWERDMDVTISKSVMATCVFPDGEIGEVDLANRNGKVNNLLDIILSEDFSVQKSTRNFDY
ncbi:hypothetical protein QT16_01280 [Pseudoalteromonas distincta]|nr:hypothetical protein QT16_01280 [Pseudoalteromonas distincta]